MKGTDPKMKRFFSRLSYSFGNEDWRTEREALQIKPDNKVLCISASGDRPLHLLLDECRQLVSVDANPVQNFLLDLKCNALKSMDYDEYIGFLGGIPNKRREAGLQKILPYLSKESAHYWSRHPRMIKKGVLYQGVLERLSGVVSKAFLVMRPLKMKKIFQIHDLEEQRKYLKKWDTFLFRKMFEVILNPKLCRFFTFEPGLSRHVDPVLSLGEYFYGRMIHSLNHSLAKDILLFSLLFRGYIEPSAFPPYLDPEGSAVIRKQLDKLQINTQDINIHLEEAGANTYDRFSLSDVASYLSRDNFHRLVGNIYRTAKPGARFCLRQFSSNQEIPSEFQNHFKREPELEKKLGHEDRCFVYRFMVGEIVK
jgi:S-adenosylmethionine-diacylglycerol 3-amino-3-carboxypropyl transferase